MWWKCKKCGKSWQSAVCNRTGKKHNGCPFCRREKRTSFPEQAIFYYVQQFYEDAINGYQISNSLKELDVFVPSIKVGIEYDGMAWHTNSQRDEIKNEICEQENIKLVRIREKGLPQISSTAYIVTPHVVSDLEKAIVLLLKNDLKVSIEKIDVDIQRDKEIIQLSYLQNKHEMSLLARYPDIVEEWHEEKNGKVTPDKISWGSGFKAWWKCKKCNHEWQTNVCSRTGNKHTGCPKCSYESRHQKYMKKMIKNTVTLQQFAPELLNEWDYEKNVDLSPDNIASKSHLRVWWKCSICGNGWQTAVSNRTNLKSGCPRCADKKKNKQSTCRKVVCIETNETFNSIGEAERQTGISHSCIIACCKGKKNHSTAGGFHWKYVDEKEL